MSVNGINSNSFDFSKLLGDKATTPATGSAGAVDFSSALKLQMASIQSQTVGSLVSSTLGSGKVSGGTSFADILGAGKTAGTSSLDAMLAGAASMSGTNGVSAVGRNMALFDPESAYRMMTDINAMSVTYKAEAKVPARACAAVALARALCHHRANLRTVCVCVGGGMRG